MNASTVSRAAPWILLAVYAVCCLAFWTSDVWRPGWDSGLYLETGRSLADGEGYRYQGEPFFLRPPGFALLLSPLLRDGAFDPRLVNSLVMAFAATGVAAVFLALRRLDGSRIALAAALLTGTHPTWVQHFNQAFAGFPFVTLLFLGMALLERSTERERRWWVASAAGALCVAGAGYVRSVAVLLLPVLALLGWRRDRGVQPLRALLPIVLIAGLLLPWWQSARSTAREAETPARQLLVHDYATALWRVDPGDPSSPFLDAAGWQRRIHRNGSRLAETLAGTTFGSDGPASRVLLGLGLAAGFGLALRRRAGLLDGWAGVYAVLLLAYFTTASRLLLPILPLLYHYLAGAAGAAGAWLGRRAGRPALEGAVVALVLAGLFALNLARLPGAVAPDPVRWNDTERMARWVRESTPEDAVLLAYSAPTLSFLTGRRTYTYRFPRGADLLERYRPDFVVFDGRTPETLRSRVAERALESWRLPSGRPGRAVAIHRLADSRTAAPHIVLVTADTLRADHLSHAGYPRETSPHLDRLAAGATVFSDAVALIPKTGPAFATVFSGRPPAAHGVRWNLVRLPRELPLLAERLAESGYRTAAFVSNPVVRSERGYGRGFETYELVTGPDAMAGVTDAFLSWADGEWQQPRFVWLHYIDPHGPYLPPRELEERFLSDPWATSTDRVAVEPAPGQPDGNKLLGAIPKYQRRGREDRVAVFVARYDAEIRAMDAQVGRVVAFLRDRGIYDDAALVFTSDHGESLGEHDFYFEHGWFAYEPSLRVPLLVKAPGQTGAATVEAQVSHLDLLPTLLALAGAPPDPGAPGANLLRPLPERGPIPIESSDRYPEKYVGVRTSRWKYLRRVSDGAEELYDLRADPGETANLAAVETEVLAELRARQREASEVAPLRPGSPVRDPDAIRDQLRALGYVE